MKLIPDSVKKFSETAEKKIDIFLTKFIPIIVFLILIFIMWSYFRALINYTDWFLWWKAYGGSDYKNSIDLRSFAIFNFSKITFDLRQLFVSGPKQTNETSIMLMQSFVLNKYRIPGQPATPSNFTTPAHIAKSIAWCDQEGPEFCGSILEQYADYIAGKQNYPSNLPPPPSSASSILQNVQNWWTKTGKAAATNNLHAYDPSWSTTKPGSYPGGFWPHLNGCSGFFDIPPGATNPAKYNLFDNIPVPRTTADGKTFNRSPLYIPGDPTCLGSWAQLFADWGIVYTTNTKAGTSYVPIISDGAACSADDGSYIQPCPTTGMGWCLACGDSQKGKGDSTDKLPVSDYLNWYTSGSSKTQSTIGWNFLAAYKIHPQSYIITSWVGDLYDDPSTGIIFDAQAFRNLVGFKDPNAIMDQGGWNLFLKGMNTNLTSYDNVMNELFRQYATDFSARATTPSDECTSGEKGKKAGADALAGAGAGAMMGSIGGPIGTILGGLIGGALGAANGFFNC